jgi:hypothetical protein
MSATAVLPPHQPFSAFATQDIEFLNGVEIQADADIQASGGSALVHEGFLRLFPEPGAICSIHRGTDRVDAKEIRFDRAMGELLCLSPNGFLENNQTYFDADTGRVQFIQNGFKPQTLLLEGRVRIASHLQGKESLAMADSAIFHASEKKIILESVPSGRVLFQQGGLEVSAPTVHIHDAIQGFGDVRLFFYPEEKSILETIFSKHL